MAVAQSDTLQNGSQWHVLISALEQEATPERRGNMFLLLLLPCPHACPFSGLSTELYGSPLVLAALLDISENPALLDGPPIAHETHNVNSSPVLGGTARHKSVSDSLPLYLVTVWEPYLLLLKVLSHVQEIKSNVPPYPRHFKLPETLVKLTTILHPLPVAT